MTLDRAIALKGTTETDASVLRRGKFTISQNGLSASGPAPLDEWGVLGHELAIWTIGREFVVGDWLNFGEEHYGEAAAQYIDAGLGWSESTLKVFRWVAAQVPPENRFLDRGLEFKHHQLVAKLAPRLQHKWLTKALGDGSEPWTTARLKAALLADADLPIVDWLLLVKCGTEAKRTEVMALLEGRGLVCKPVEKRQRVERKKRKGKAKAS